MLLSIIVTSQDRPKELKRYFETINKQKNINFSNLQIIFVDQGDNKSIYDNLSQSIIRKYVKYHKCGLSEARNQGLKFVIGDIVALGMMTHGMMMTHYRKCLTYLKKET